MNRSRSASIVLGLVGLAAVVLGGCACSDSRPVPVHTEMGGSVPSKARVSKGKLAAPRRAEAGFSKQRGGPIFGESLNGDVGPSGTITFEITVLDCTLKDETAIVELLPDDAGGDASVFFKSWTRTVAVKKGSASFEVSFTTKDSVGLKAAGAESLEPVLFTVHFDGSFQSVECGFVIKNK